MPSSLCDRGKLGIVDGAVSWLDIDSKTSISGFRTAQSFKHLSLTFFVAPLPSVSVHLEVAFSSSSRQSILDSGNDYGNYQPGSMPNSFRKSPQCTLQTSSCLSPIRRSTSSSTVPRHWRAAQVIFSSLLPLSKVRMHGRLMAHGI